MAKQEGQTENTEKNNEQDFQGQIESLKDEIKALTALVAMQAQNVEFKDQEEKKKKPEITITTFQEPGKKPIVTVA